MANDVTRKTEAPATMKLSPRKEPEKKIVPKQKTGAEAAP